MTEMSVSELVHFNCDPVPAPVWDRPGLTVAPGFHDGRMHWSAVWFWETVDGFVVAKKHWDDAKRRHVRVWRTFQVAHEAVEWGLGC